MMRPLVLMAVVGVALSVPSGVQAQGRTTQSPPTHRDLQYAVADGKPLQLDLYLPEKPAAKPPLVVWIHGGGWAAGDKAGCPARRLVERGYAVASVNYRLSGAAIFPAQIEDCKAALRWLRAHAERYGFDPDHIGVWGSSAGGHLVALLGTAGNVRTFDVGEHRDVSSRVQAVCDYYGPTDLTQMDAHALPTARLKHDEPNSPESRLLGGPVQERREQAARANPITYVTPDAPPFLIVHGDQDPVVPWHQSQLLYDALAQAGARVRLHTIEGAGHGQGFGGKDLEDLVDAFFDRHLKGVAPGDAPRTQQTRSKAQGPMGQGPQGGPAGRPGKPAAPGQSGFNGKPPAALVQRILEREDANGDGKVTRAEFRGPPPMFDRLDVNHDGVLSREDLEPAAAKPAAEPQPARGPRPRTQSSGQPPRGLFVCRGPNATPQREVDFPFISGWLVRPGWSQVEPREGGFDWTFIDNEIALAEKLQKKITLCVLGGPQTPDWVFQAGAQEFKYTMPVGRRGATRIPVLWDKTYLEKWTVLVRALGQRYDGHATVVLVHMTGATGNGLEMQLPFRPEDRTAWQQIGFTPQKAADGWKTIVDAYAAAFPRKPLDIDVHPVLGSDQVAGDVAAYASRKLGSRFGIFGGWLSGKSAQEDRHHAGMQALAQQYGPQGFAAFQMVASQTPNRSNPAFSNLFAEGGLKAAVDQALDWNAHYFEIWESDATNAELHPLLGELAAKIAR